MAGSIENGVLWQHLLEKKTLKVDAREGLIAGGVRIYRVTKGEHKEIIGRREAPAVLIAALESKKKTVSLKVIDLSKNDLVAVAQAITKDIVGQKDDFVGGVRQILQILRGLVEKEKGGVPEPQKPKAD